MDGSESNEKIRPKDWDSRKGLAARDGVDGDCCGVGSWIGARDTERRASATPELND